MAVNFKSEEEVQKFLDNLGIEYRFGCLSEKKPEVCHLLGDYLESIKKDFQKASKVYKSNCDDYSFGKSCYKFAGYSFVGKGCKEDRTLAKEYFKKGCSLNDADSCLNAGIMLVTPKLQTEPKRDYTEGLSLIQQGCEKGSANSCFYLSGMHITGIADVLEKDMTKAFEFSKKACEMGNLYACANLSQMYKKGEGVAQDEKMAEKYRQTAIEMRDQLQGKGRTLEFQQGIPEK